MAKSGILRGAGGPPSTVTEISGQAAQQAYVGAFGPPDGRQLTPKDPSKDQTQRAPGDGQSDPKMEMTDKSKMESTINDVRGGVGQAPANFANEGSVG